MPLRVKPAEYARHRGVSRQAVSKAIRAHRIQLVDGLVDVELADAQWTANTDPATPSNSVAGAPQEAVPLGLRRPPGEDPGGQLLLVQLPSVTRREAALARQVRDSQPGRNGGNGAGKTPDSYLSARASREAWAAQLTRMQFEERVAALLPADRVRAEIYRVGTRTRDALRVLPSQLAPVVAGLSDPEACRLALLEEITKVIDELSRLETYEER